MTAASAVSTDDFAPRERAPIWREWIWKHFGGLESDLYGDTDFDGHLVDFDGPAPGTRSERPFGHGNFHTEYAQTSHREDFADSYKDVHGDPTELHDAVDIDAFESTLCGGDDHGVILAGRTVVGPTGPRVARTPRVRPMSPRHAARRPLRALLTLVGATAVVGG